jgi:hypothetical protein
MTTSLTRGTIRELPIRFVHHANERNTPDSHDRGQPLPLTRATSSLWGHLFVSLTIFSSWRWTSHQRLG